VIGQPQHWLAVSCEPHSGMSFTTRWVIQWKDVQVEVLQTPLDTNQWLGLWWFIGCFPTRKLRFLYQPPRYNSQWMGSIGFAISPYLRSGDQQRRASFVPWRNLADKEMRAALNHVHSDTSSITRDLQSQWICLSELFEPFWALGKIECEAPGRTAKYQVGTK
jgi:hypothetical protein